MEEQMEIKRFIADDIRAAMISVKETLGSDAVILSNRRKGDRIEILAAKELDPESIWPTHVSNDQSQQRVSVSTENSNSEMVFVRLTKMTRNIKKLHIDNGFIIPGSFWGPQLGLAGRYFPPRSASENGISKFLCIAYHHIQGVSAKNPFAKQLFSVLGPS